MAEERVRRLGDRNEVRLTGTIASREALRYTPAGIPVLTLSLEHASGQVEAEVPRRVELHIEAMVIGELARRMERLQVGQPVSVRGFLANRSRRSTRVILHVNEFETDERT